MGLKADEVDWFWNIVESSERTLKKMCKKLETLSQEELVNFQRICWHLKEDVNPFTRSDEMKIGRACSEDHGDDFSGWVIAEGRAFFENVRDHPEDAQKHNDFLEREHRKRWDTSVDDEDYKGYQSVDMIAKAVYEKKFDEDIDEALEEALDEDFDS